MLLIIFILFDYLYRYRIFMKHLDIIFIKKLRLRIGFMNAEFGFLLIS